MAKKQKNWEDVLGMKPEKIRRSFSKGIEEKAQREQNYHDNVAARDKIFGEVAGMKPEEFPEPFSEEQRDRLYDKGVYKESQLPAYRRAYKRGEQRGTTPSADAEGTGAPQQQQLLPGQMQGESFSSWLQRQEEHNSRWNKTPENTDGDGPYELNMEGWHYDDDGKLVDKDGNEVDGWTDEPDKLSAYALGIDDESAMNEAYSRASQAARQSFREGNGDRYATLETAFGVDPDRVRRNEEELKRIEQDRRRSGLFHGLATVADIISASAGGNVWKRDADNRDYAKESQLVRAQEAADALNASKQKEAYRLQLLKAEDQYADQVGKQAAADLKSRRDIEHKRWIRFHMNHQKDLDRANAAEIARKNRESQEKIAQNRNTTQIVVAESRNEGGSGGAKDKTFYIGTENKRKKVSKAMYDSYVNELMVVIRRYAQAIPIGADPDAEGNVTLQKALKAYIYKNSSNVLMPSASAGGDQVDLTGTTGYPKAILKKYLGSETLAALDRYWQSVLESGGE